MLVSEKNKATFIHIPKTGGSSLARILSRNAFNHLPERIKCNKNYVKNPLEWTTKHSRMHELDMRYQNFFCFAFLRNPWDLMVSSFSWWTQKAKAKIRKNHGDNLKAKGFKSFIKSDSSYINECYHKNEGQLYWLNNKVDFIGKFENIQQDFDIICDKIGIPRQILPHANKTNHEHYSEYYDDETREIVEKKYIKDIEYFSYEFGE